jgi:hypothetical protein
MCNFSLTVKPDGSLLVIHVTIVTHQDNLLVPRILAVHTAGLYRLAGSGGTIVFP